MRKIGKMVFSISENIDMMGEKRNRFDLSKEKLLRKKYQIKKMVSVLHKNVIILLWHLFINKRVLCQYGDPTDLAANWEIFHRNVSHGQYFVT